MTGTQARPLADARRACFARSILSISGLGDGIAPGDMARQAAPRPSNPPSAAAPCDRPDKTNVDGTPQDTSISFDLTGRLRKHYRNLAQPTRRCAEPQTLRTGRRLRLQRRPIVCPECRRIGLQKRASQRWTEADERHKIVTARNQS